LASRKNQWIRSGEYIDDLAHDQILETLNQVTPNFENAIRNIPLKVHRINYDQLKIPSEIYEKVINLVLDWQLNLEMSDLQIPINGLNISIAPDKIEILNQFNRLNLGGRELDYSCPLVFSNSFPEQSDRFKMFTRLLYENIELDRAVAERNMAVAERNMAVAERNMAVAERDMILNSTTWRIFRIYRKLLKIMKIN